MQSVLLSHGSAVKFRHSIPSLLAYLAGAALTTASAATNVRYALGKSDDPTTNVIWATVAIAASVALALAPSAFVASLSARRYGGAMLALLAVVMFGGYSVAAALGSAAGGRFVADAETMDTIAKRNSALSRIETATRELAGLRASRTRAELEALIDRQMASRRDLNDCVGWLPYLNARTVCAAVSELKAERGITERRSELERLVGEARAELASLRAAATVANADALALQNFAAAMGLTVSTDTLNRLLIVLAVLVIEIGGGLALAVGRELGSISETPRPAQ